MKRRTGDALLWSFTHAPLTLALLAGCVGGCCAVAWLAGRRIT